MRKEFEEMYRELYSMSQVDDIDVSNFIDLWDKSEGLIQPAVVQKVLGLKYRQDVQNLVNQKILNKVQWEEKSFITYKSLKTHMLKEALKK